MTDGRMDGAQAGACNEPLTLEEQKMPVRPFRVEVNAVRQESAREPTAAVLALAQHIEATFAAGTHDLPGLVDSLNARGSRAPGGRAWTDHTLMAELARQADAA